jgi:SpoVK/Ycf46/Vps4 family AAA+-type ATPase
MKISHMCQEDPERFICVLIDEVESIASSRQAVMMRSESQDSLRATNALLTGLDRTRSYPNLIFLCTSNMLESLDSAFMDRCGLKRSVDPPSFASQYEILRSRTQKLIARGVILSLEVLPSYIDADLDSDAGKANAGSKLLALVKLIRSGNAHSQSGTEISARSLTQLPEQAILRYLREEECDLDLALDFFERFVLAEQSQSKRYEDKDAIPEDDAEEFEGIEFRGRKRNLKIVLEEDSTIDILEEVLAELRRRAKEMTGQVKEVGEVKEAKEVPL